MSGKGNRCWNINGLCDIVGKTVTDNIHAILGCDTTSGVFGLGKKVSVSKFKSDTQLQDQGKIFTRQGSSKDDIISSGEAALVSLY